MARFHLPLPGKVKPTPADRNTSPHRYAQPNLPRHFQQLSQTHVTLTFVMRSMLLHVERILSFTSSRHQELRCNLKASRITVQSFGSVSYDAISRVVKVRGSGTSSASFQVMIQELIKPNILGWKKWHKDTLHFASCNFIGAGYELTISIRIAKKRVHDC